MKELLRYLLLLIVIVGVFQFSGSVLAEDDDSTTTENHDEDTKTEDKEDEDKTDDEDELDEEEEKDAYEREVELKQEKDKFEIKSKLKVGENKDEIEIKFDADDDPEIELKYKSKAESTEAEFKYKVKFDALFEYVENSTVADGFQENEEVSKYKFEDMEWNDLLYVTDVVAGVNVYVITASTTDGVFKLILQVSEGLAQLNENSTLTPNSLKIDVEIHNFPYTVENSSLALKTKIKTESKYELKEEEDTLEEQAGFTADEAQVSVGEGFFSWIETAVADGQEIEVKASTVVDASDEDAAELEVGEKSGKMYFSFITEGAVDIVWDPKVGVQSQATLENIQALLNPNSQGGGLPGFNSIIGLLALFSIGIGIRQKRRY